MSDALSDCAKDDFVGDTSKESVVDSNSANYFEGSSSRKSDNADQAPGPPTGSGQLHQQPEFVPGTLCFEYHCYWNFQDTQKGTSKDCHQPITKKQGSR